MLYVFFFYNCYTFIIIFTACDPALLTDGIRAISQDITCNPPLNTLKPTGINNGVVCYSGISIGSFAHYYCLSCDNMKMVVMNNEAPGRVCTEDGSWNGTIPSCECMFNSVFEPRLYYIIIYKNILIHTDDHYV